MGSGGYCCVLFDVRCMVDGVAPVDPAEGQNASASTYYER